MTTKDRAISRIAAKTCRFLDAAETIVEAATADGAVHFIPADANNVDFADLKDRKVKIGAPPAKR